MKRRSIVYGLICGLITFQDAMPTYAAGDEPNKFVGPYAGLVFGFGVVDGSWSDGSFPPVTTKLSSEGGFAGITAGHILQKQGIDFQILEAASTHGGRVKKASDFVDFPIDLGGDQISGLDKSLCSLRQLMDVI